MCLVWFFFDLTSVHGAIGSCYFLFGLVTAQQITALLNTRLYNLVTIRGPSGPYGRSTRTHHWRWSSSSRCRWWETWSHCCSHHHAHGHRHDHHRGHGAGSKICLHLRIPRQRAIHHTRHQLILREVEGRLRTTSTAAKIIALLHRLESPYQLLHRQSIEIEKGFDRHHDLQIPC